MPDGGISLLPEEMREKEGEELKEKKPEPKDRPELYVPGRQEGPTEPESVPTPPPPPAKPDSPKPESPAEKEEPIIPYKQRPKKPGAKPPKRKTPPPKRSLRVSLIPEEEPEKKMNIRGRKIFLAVLVGIEIIALAGIAFFLQAGINSKNNQINEIDADIAAVKEQLDSLRDQEQDLFLFEDKMAVMDELLSGHVYNSKIFTFLEEHTLPDVWYTSFISSSEGSVNLKASTKDLKTAAKQVAHLQSQEEIISINVNNFITNINDLGEVVDATFEMQINFNENFLLNTAE